MFMLPPIPGVPVYIAGGIIITAKMDDKIAEDTLNANFLKALF